MELTLSFYSALPARSSSCSLQCVPNNALSSVYRVSCTSSALFHRLCYSYRTPLGSHTALVPCEQLFHRLCRSACSWLYGCAHDSASLWLSWRHANYSTGQPLYHNLAWQADRRIVNQRTHISSHASVPSYDSYADVLVECRNMFPSTAFQH